VDCDALDSLGNSPLHFAARAGAVELCRLLLSFGASTASVRNSLGLTPLENAQMMRPQTEELAEVEQLLSKNEEGEEEGHASDRSPSLQSADNTAHPSGVRLRHRSSPLSITTHSNGTTLQAAVVSAGSSYEENKRVRTVHRPLTRDEVDTQQLKEKGRLMRASKNKASVEMVTSATVKERDSLQLSRQSADNAVTPTATADDEGSLTEDGDGISTRQSNSDDDDDDDDDGDDPAASLTAADAFASSIWTLTASLIDAALSMFLTPAAPLQRAESHRPIQGSSMKKSHPMALQWRVSLWTQLMSWSTVFRSSDQGISGGDEVGEASLDSRPPLSSAPPPPTDKELSIRGLGNVTPSPAAAASPSFLSAEQQLAPQLAPPDEVQVAIAMSRSATGGRRKDALLPMDLLHPPDLHHNARGDGPVDRAMDPFQTALRPPTPTQPNVYSIGNALPRGAAWRYVDVLNNSR